MDITVRRAGLDDLGELMAWRMEVLHHVFGIPEDDPDMYASNLDYYKREIPCGGHIAVFAEIGRARAGCGGLCLYREMPSPDNPGGRCGYLMNIYTREEYRRRGVGKAVVRRLADLARERGASKIYLESTGLGRPLYESLGFRDMENYMKLRGGECRE